MSRYAQLRTNKGDPGVWREHLDRGVACATSAGSALSRVPIWCSIARGWDPGGADIRVVRVSWMIRHCGGMIMRRVVG